MTSDALWQPDDSTTVAARRAAELFGGPELWTPYPKQALAEEYAQEVDELLFGGAAGPGKTEWGMEHVIGQMRAYPGNLGVIFRRVRPSLEDVIRRLTAKLRGECEINKTTHTYTFPNGSVIYTGSLQYEDSVLDYQGWEIGVAFFEELTEFLESQWEYLLGRLRVPSTVTGTLPHPHAIATTNPGGKGHKWVKRRWVKPKPEDIDNPSEPPSPGEIWRPRFDPEIHTPEAPPLTRVFIPATHEDNPALLEKTPDYLSKLRAQSNRGLRMAMERGDWDAIEEVVGALWEYSWLDGGRLAEMLSFKRRTILGVDPSDGEEKGDAFGVCVASKGFDNVGYVLLSDEWKGVSTREMAEGVVDLYHELNCDMIVWEKNHGGKWGPEVVRLVDPNVNLKVIAASEGKMTRAEPVAALFQPQEDAPPHARYRARLIGWHPNLEDSLTGYTGKPGEASPNELDAMVWALTELMLGRRTAKTKKSRDNRLRGRR